MYAIKLKPDYEERPLLLSDDGVVYLETYSKLYRVAYEFLIMIAEAVERPNLIHKYKISKNSLYSAMVLQQPPEIILKILLKLIKNEAIPPYVTSFVLQYTSNYGRAKMILHDDKYYLMIHNQVHAELEANLKQRGLDIAKILVPAGAEIQMDMQFSQREDEGEEEEDKGRDSDHKAAKDTVGVS